jgi:hypothetical protein
MLDVIDNCERFPRLRFADESAAAKWQKNQPAAWVRRAELG